MTSIVEICNAALDHLGVETITSLNDESKPARYCNRRYRPVRDAVLRAHPWNCAMRRASLARLAAGPAFGPANAFHLPTDCLRVLRMEDDRLRFKIEGRTLVTNGAAAKILYTARIEDPNEFDALFVEALAARLAAEIAFPLAQSGSLRGEMWALYEHKIREARGADAQEGSADVLIADEWLSARAAGIANPYGADVDF